MASRKQFIPNSQRRIKIQYTIHQRYKSENNQSPSNTISQVLTQRCTRKFAEVYRELTKMKNPFELNQVDQFHQIPRFLVKRKYLSFDYRTNNKSKQIDKSKDKIILLPNAGIKQLESSQNLSADFGQKIRNLNEIKQSKEQLKRQNKQKIKCKETKLGTYLIPNNINNCNKHKFKSIYIKKNLRKVTLNPQLKISRKSPQQKKQSQIQTPRQRIRKYELANIHQSFLFRRKQNKSKPKVQQQKKMFRPWSGQQFDQNL